MRRYQNGQRVGAFTIVEYVGNKEFGPGVYQIMYCARCSVCGRETILPSQQIRYRRDCGCNSPLRFGNKYKKKRNCWMDEGEIYRSWKCAIDKLAQITILAQLNDVGVTDIKEIINRQASLYG